MGWQPGVIQDDYRPGTRLCFSGGVVIEWVEPRKPCFVLQDIHEALEKETIGRMGYMARVICGGSIRPGEAISVIGPASNGPSP